MKIVYIGTKNTFIIEQLLNSRHNIIGIVESRPENKTVSYFITRIFDLFQFLTRKKLIGLSSRAIASGVPYKIFKNSSQKKVETWIRQLNPDIIVVQSMFGLLKKEVFSIPVYGAINYHQAPLPNYRGPNPDFWIYHDMELLSGGTVHIIDATADTGNIIGIERFQMTIGLPLETYLLKHQEIGLKLILKALEDIEAQKDISVPQDKSATAKARRITKAELRSLIDWEAWPVERIFHLLRGPVNPTDIIAFDKFDRLFRKWKATSFNKTPLNELPGKVVRTDEKILLCCKDGTIALKAQFSLKPLFMKLIV
ncbi:methionyl-tRNA formyltransferase [Solitalea longa]|uniref:methionyl-tRNA formyltransferase n=1 Tax=Solitalea longa TaxID=2079460 RepID=UPI0013FD3EEA|nr:formyltransferase family protein [Solitalea longa]